MVIERAHRLGPARPSSDSRPLVVIFKSLSFTHKEAICAASQKLKEIRWNASHLFIFQDYSAEGLEKSFLLSVPGWLKK